MKSTSLTQERLRFRILVPIWGQSYVDDFCEIALPALLAENNLRLLAQEADCEVIFLTASASQMAIEVSRGIAYLADICSYSFVFIDDLLCLDGYGFILTIAYGRGIASLGDKQTSTHFIFLNGDFVFSNGLLRTVLERVKLGFRAVIAPSLRCTSEDVGRLLRDKVHHDEGEFSADAEDLLGITLKNLHPTAAASIVNHGTTHSTIANQFFWQVDEDTMIGRFFLMFMLCIRPEVPFVAPNGWCDYVLIPELVPSGNYDVLTDSADGFILELQARAGESEYLLKGRPSPKEFAPRLSTWTTPHHRDYASRDVIFHAGPIPENLEEARDNFNKYMIELFSHLSDPATPHKNHPFWTGTLALKRRTHVGVLPTELLEESVTALLPAGASSSKRLLSMLRGHTVRNVITTDERQDVQADDMIIDKDAYNPARASRGRIFNGGRRVRRSQEIISVIERLHGLQRDGILTESEFSEKKKDLLSRI